MQEATLKRVWEEVPLPYIAVGLGFSVATFYGRRLLKAPDLKTRFLEDRYKIGRALRDPPDVLFKYQLALSHRQLQRTSPTAILRKYMKDRHIPATLKRSSVLKFYNEVYKNYEGITSSSLGYKEGKTLSCLSILADIEKENLNDRNVVFLLVEVENDGLTEAMKRTLRIQDGENVCHVLRHLSRHKDGNYVIFGLIDQLDEWDDENRQDLHTLKSMVVHDFTSLRVHIPSAIPKVAANIDRVNGKKMAVDLGQVTPTFRHDLTEDEVTDYVNLLSDDPRVQSETKKRLENSPYINPLLVIDTYKKVKNRSFER